MLQCLKQCVLLIIFIIFPQRCSPATPIGSQNKLTTADIFNPYPSGNANTATKNNLPKASKKGSTSSLMSFIKKINPEVQHPNGKALFPDDNQLGQLLTTFLTNLGKNKRSKSFTVFFTKIHLLILHQLYQYLTKIYTVFNMTHIDALVPYTDSQGVAHEGYLVEGARQALVRKTLIINHLINIIEAQSNGAIRARFPSLPPVLATYTGNMLMKHDYGADLTVMLDKAEVFLFSEKTLQDLVKPAVTQIRDTYSSLFADYLKFFNRYTQTLNANDTSKGYVSINIFARHAQRIAQIMEGHVPALDPALKGAQKVTWLRSLKLLNPPLFFYDEKSIRALKIIPALAQSLPQNVESVPYPAKLVQDAKSGAFYKPKFGPETTKPLAFFKKDRLFVNIPTMQYLYTQELLPQPAWMNSVEGIMKMLRACLGDFSMIVDPVLASESILDPCLECIVRNSSVKAGIITGSDDKSCQACQAFLKAINDKITARAIQEQQTQLPDQTGGPTLPGG